MKTVTSADGTSIAFEQHGDGPPLVLLHGSSGDHHAWDGVVPHLADDFTLIVPDRRDRGHSGDADAHSLAHEVADLEAIADSIEDDITVFGHSYGGLVALAAATEMDFESLVLYEPAMPVGEHRGDDLTARQREVIQTAWEMSYQEVPKEVSADEIAGEVTLDSSTVNERLQRAERNVLKQVL